MIRACSRQGTQHGALVQWDELALAGALVVASQRWFRCWQSAMGCGGAAGLARHSGGARVYFLRVRSTKVVEVARRFRWWQLWWRRGARGAHLKSHCSGRSSRAFREFKHVPFHIGRPLPLGSACFCRVPGVRLSSKGRTLDKTARLEGLTYISFVCGWCSVDLRRAREEESLSCHESSISEGMSMRMRGRL